MMQLIKHRNYRISIYMECYETFCKNILQFVFILRGRYSFAICNIKPFFCYTNYFEREVGTYIVMPIQDVPVIIVQSGRVWQNVE